MLSTLQESSTSSRTEKGGVGNTRVYHVSLSLKRVSTCMLAYVDMGPRDGGESTGVDIIDPRSDLQG